MVCVFLVSVLTLTGCNAQQDPERPVAPNQESSGEDAEGSVLDFYRQHSSFTDPGEYGYLYENLPDSLPELCSLVKSQFIHPYAVPEYREQIPRERWSEYLEYPTAESILEGLLSYDSSGLISDRELEDRLVLGCQQNALVLASILRCRGIPVRVRYGHVDYLVPGSHASHVICEVWNEDDRRWMLVDPSTDRIDFGREEFDFSNELWLELQRGEVDLSLYGIPGRYSGTVSIIAKVPLDLASILGTEYPITQYAPILDYAFENNDELTAGHIEALNEISERMRSIDAESLSRLNEIYDSTPEIQLSESSLQE